MSTVELSIDDNLAIISLVGEPFHCITWSFPHDLKTALDASLQDSRVRALVIKGTKRVFSAGADISVLRDLTDPATARRWLAQQHRAILDLASVPLPVVALIEGAASGAGMNLALAADHIVAAPKARFSQAFVGIGLATDMGSLYLLPQRVGEHRARELMYSGRTVELDEAHRLGLVDTIVDADTDPVTAALAVAESYAARPLHAFAAIKEGVARSRGQSFEQTLDLELDLQLPICSSADFAEGTSAFLAKRKPRYVEKAARSR